MSLNKSQQKIADTLEGMIVVDAGPGTGKTHTVVARCINIMRKKGFDPKDLVMLTFTKNAAAEMRERVQSTVTEMFVKNEIDGKEYRTLIKSAKRVNISTFDSFCLSIVKSASVQVSRFFRINETLTRKADITENESLNKAYFKRFLDRYLDENGSEFGNLAAIAAENPMQVYSLINRLMARGILPFAKTESRKRFWFSINDGKELIGDVEALRKQMDSFEGLGKDDAEKFADIPDASGFDLASKHPSPEMLDMAANEDRTELINMIHGIFHEYIRNSIADDRLTFGLVASFAYVALFNDGKTRADVATKYLIVDEFQDTNSNQLMISLMVLKEPNLCVVGDWKQGIYGFRFVSIENITEFDSRVRELRYFLNNVDGTERIGYSIPDTIKLSLVENYRSSKTVIDTAYESLYAPGSKTEEIDNKTLSSQITLINSRRDEIGEYTGIECVRCDDKYGETDEVLRRIQQYRKSGGYMIVDGKDSEPRRPMYKDIAVLCRNTESCRAVYQACLEHKIPAFLQGDVNVMGSEEGKLLLAWLRYISNDKDPWGISAILAHMGYSFYEIQYMKAYDRESHGDHIPQELKDFRRSLRSKRRRITQLVSAIFSYYGMDNDITQAITAVLSGTHRNSLATISDLIRSIENDIEMDTKYDVDGLPESDAVVIQTIHKSKGLEYPIVIIPRIDVGCFPAPSADKSLFFFNDLTGIRCGREIVRFGNEIKIADSWKTVVVKKSQKADYSEERRLYFVAISRAKQYVTLIAGDNKSRFFDHYSGKLGTQSAGTDPVPTEERKSEELIPKPAVPEFRPRRKNLSGHDLLHFEFGKYQAEKGSDEMCPKGMQYGTEVHKLAELMVKGIPLEERKFREYPELANIKTIVDGLRSRGAELKAEQDCFLPLNEINVTVSGRIDMIAFFDDVIEVHDWKTDVEQTAVEEYKIQLSIYAKALGGAYGKKVVCYLDWVSQNKVTEFEACATEELIARAKRFLTVRNR